MGTTLQITAPTYELLYCSTVPHWNRLLLGIPMVCDSHMVLVPLTVRWVLLCTQYIIHSNLLYTCTYYEY